MQCPLISANLQDWLAARLYHCKYPHGNLLFIQACSDPTPVHCNTVQGKMPCPLISAALQDWLAAGLYHCKYTNEDLLFLQVCRDPTPVHCNTVQGKMQCPLISAALQDWLAAGLYHCRYMYDTFTKISSSHRSAGGTQPQLTITLFRAKCSAH